MGEQCTWCGAEVEADDGFRAYELAGERRAVFCRLEHLIPWAIQGAHWDAGGARVPDGARVGDSATRGVREGNQIYGEANVHQPTECSQCGAELGDVHVLLVRHRGEHRVADAFCSVDHMEQWAKAGGRWQ
ncbi:MAG: hypothetical protein ACRDL6_10170 [Solirubrobacterales bacterium]